MARRRIDGVNDRTEPHLLTNTTQGLALRLADFGRARTLAQVMALLEGDTALTAVFSRNLDWRLLAPLGRSQCRMIWDKQQMVGFVTWANVDPARAAALNAAEDFRIETADWSSGEQPWVVDAVILPGSEAALARTFATLFPDGVEQFAQGLNTWIQTGIGRLTAAQ
jgi:hemolysin-activating ACP:hemolysin acyltransferase